MIVRRAILLSLLLVLPPGVLNADTLVIRDSIGPDSSLTDGMPGVLTIHSGATWATPGLVLNAPESGELSEARFVIFARDQANQPENNLANIYGYPMELHVWTEGIEGWVDSFDENPRGFAVPGHIDVDINSSTLSFITIVPFGHTGPPNDPTLFTTFLVTADLSTFDIALEGGQEYVVGIIQDNESNFISGGGFFRLSASLATGFEDVFRSNLTTAVRPGYVGSQHAFGYEQFGGKFTLTTYGPGDYDFDGDVDDDDYDKWRSEFGTTSFMSDGNDDGTVDAADYVVWRKHLPTMAGSGASRAPPAVPEPTAAALGLLALLPILRRPRRQR